MTIGEKIRTERKRLKLTQTELGEMLGVKTNAVSKWECGRVEEIPTSKIKAMANIFDVPTSYLIDDEKMPPTFLDEGLADVAAIFKKLSPDNRAKLIELSLLYLDAQNKIEENQ